MQFVVNILEGFLGEHKKHSEDTGQINFDCPSCSEEKGMPDGDGKGKLEVNYKKGVFKCWVCGYRNGMHGVIEKLIKRYGTDSQLRNYLLVKPDYQYESNSLDYDEYQDIAVDLPKGFIPLSNCNGYENGYYYAKKYLTQRNITNDIIKDFNIGITNEDKNYEQRVIIPSYNANGQINYYTGRSISKYVWPKYLNANTENENVIFNENRINWDATIYLVEGPFDHIVTPNSICLMGKYLHPRLKHLLFTKAKGDIVIVLDPDAYEDAMAIYNNLNIGHLFGRIKLVTPPYEEDPASIYKQLGSRGVMLLLRSAKITV